MEKLKLAAQERGLSVIRKRKSGPFLVMNSKTGKTIGNFLSFDEAEKAIMATPLLPKEEDRRPVVWNSDVNIVEFPKKCSNGWGPTCLCLDESAVYLCAVPPCMYKAGCRGICTNH